MAERRRQVLSPDLQEKADTFGESSYGATTVTVTLRDGRRIPDVVLAWNSEIVRVDGYEMIPFEAEDVVDVEEQLH